MATLNKEKLTILKDSTKADNKGRIALGNSYAGKNTAYTSLERVISCWRTLRLFPKKSCGSIKIPMR